MFVVPYRSHSSGSWIHMFTFSHWQNLIGLEFKGLDDVLFEKCAGELLMHFHEKNCSPIFVCWENYMRYIDFSTTALKESDELNLDLMFLFLQGIYRTNLSFLVKPCWTSYSIHFPSSILFVDGLYLSWCLMPLTIFWIYFYGSEFVIFVIL